VSSYALYSGSLPSGISINTASGALTGTPVDGSAGTYNFVLSASGDGGTIYTSGLSLVVANDGQRVHVYNSATSTWQESIVYIYNEADSTWKESSVKVWDAASGTWIDSV
jgi:hypothetical protein